MANYKISPEARDDLKRIWFYGLDNFGEKAADKYRDRFIAHFQVLAENPYLYPATDTRKGYRRSICGNDSVYYRVIGEDVEVIAIIGRQDTGAWLG